MSFDLFNLRGHAERSILEFEEDNSGVSGPRVFVVNEPSLSPLF